VGDSDDDGRSRRPSKVMQRKKIDVKGGVSEGEVSSIDVRQKKTDWDNKDGLGKQELF